MPRHLDDTDLRIPAHVKATDGGRSTTTGEFEWSRWDAGEHPVRTAVMLLVVAAAAVTAGVTLRSPASGLLALALLLATLANHLLPIRYAMTGDGVSVRGLLRKRLLRWSRIDAARFSRTDAVLLYTTEHSVNQRQFRVDLGPQPDEVATVLKQRLLDAGVPLV
ncbi:hypothetical protein Pla123a_00750 [Posidoniimonas polymericola]|uniref:Low molecular weight protein antigen 6 PH domain-containing protein n=1 Tax=Posidoniimonas polymericola TaxID=2528002 RepID=A0A5C5ZDM1_9BACT|nr:PH domain-containing protein [Posidoniimonas polymericola]TWT85268.1 hypothetical protein Pla123a_00750 [Posidoniimonas polymericola]